MSFDYNYLYGYTGVFHNHNVLRDPQETTLLDEIMDYAKSIGISPDEISMLLEFGYDEYEIEELLYDPITLQSTLEELYCEGYPGYDDLAWGY